MLLPVFLLLMTGCGSSGSGNTQRESGEATAQAVGLEPKPAAQAEGICKQSLREIDKLGRQLAQALADSSSRDLIGSELVAPGIEILDRESSRLESLPASDSPEFELYVGLFAPIIELAEQRLEAGEADEPERGQALERLIAGLEDEQVATARRLGLDACSVGFTEALGGRT